MAFGLFWLAWILWTTVTLGVGGPSMDLFTQMTPAPNTAGGGPANAIFGSFAMVGLATLFGTPLGILAGIYRRVRQGRSAGQRGPFHQRHPAVGAFDRHRPVRLCAGGHPHGALLRLGRVCALAPLQVPIVVRTTENMLNLGAQRLARGRLRPGTPKWEDGAVDHGEVVLCGHHHRRAAGGCAYRWRNRAAAVHRAVEPVLSSDLNKPMANLPVTIFRFAMSPFTEWQQLAGGRVPDHHRCARAEYPARMMFKK